MGVSFYIFLYIFTYIKIHSRREKYALNKEMHHTLRFCAFDSCEKYKQLERKART